MAAEMFITPSRGTDGNGYTLSGAKWYFYATGTTTPQTVYADADLTTPHTNPVVADAGGLFDAIYLNAANTYRAILKQADGTVISDFDPVNFPATVELKTLVDFGAVGDGTVDDTTAIQAALDSGDNIEIDAGKTFKFTSDISISTSNQTFGGSGTLKPVGNCGVIVEGGCTGAEVDLTFNSSGHTGWALTVNNANRVRIKKLHCIDVNNVLYVTKANTVTVDWVWAVARGAGIKWFGNDTTRSDILHINFAVIDPADTEYGMNWDGNCHSLEIKYLGLVGGKGFVIQNTAGVTTYPAIGRIGHFEQDYSTGIGLEIKAGLDYDFNMPYILGSTSDGIKVAATINDYEVRIHGGKSVGNGGYGINNLGGVVLFGSATALYSNTPANTNGNVWSMAPRFALDATAYFTLQSGNPYFGYDTNDYETYDRATNTHQWFVDGASVLGYNANSVLAYKPLSLTVYTFATLPGPPQEGWLAVITDSNTAVFNAAAAGGGANVVKVCYLGGSWKVA